MRSGSSVTIRPPQATHVTVDPSRSAPFGVLSSSALVPLGDAASCAKARPLKRVADLGEQVERLKFKWEEVLQQQSLRTRVAEGAHLGRRLFWRP
jgi:hypothetical protein